MFVNQVDHFLTTATVSRGRAVLWLSMLTACSSWSRPRKQRNRDVIEALNRLHADSQLPIGVVLNMIGPEQ